MVNRSMDELVNLIACPTCHARMTEGCRSKNGNALTRPHQDRLVERWWVCERCLVAVAAGKHYCEPCRRRVLQDAKNEWARLRRQAARGRWA